MTEHTLMEFPCDFPVKIIGNNTANFVSDIKEIVLKHFPDFDMSRFTESPSKNNNYLAMTATVVALNQEMLDAFYQDLTKHPDVKMVL